MEFANWLFENNWYPDTGYLKDNLWVNEYGEKKYTTQLYDEFQKISKPKVNTVFLNPSVEFFSIVNVSSGPVQLNYTLPQFKWYDAVVADNTIRLVPNDLILPQTTIDIRVVTNALGQIVYLGTEDMFTVPGKGIYFCLTLLKGQGGTFLAGNSVSTW